MKQKSSLTILILFVLALYGCSSGIRISETPLAKAHVAPAIEYERYNPFQHLSLYLKNDVVGRNKILPMEPDVIGLEDIGYLTFTSPEKDVRTLSYQIYSRDNKLLMEAKQFTSSEIIDLAAGDYWLVNITPGFPATKTLLCIKAGRLAKITFPQLLTNL